MMKCWFLFLSGKKKKIAPVDKIRIVWPGWEIAKHGNGSGAPGFHHKKH